MLLLCTLQVYVIALVTISCGFLFFAGIFLVFDLDLFLFFAGWINFGNFFVALFLFFVVFAIFWHWFLSVENWDKKFFSLSLDKRFYRSIIEALRCESV